MSYTFYKLLHLAAIVTLFTSIGSIFTIYFSQQNTQTAFKKWMSMLHGLSLLVLFVSGFGLLAKASLMDSGIPSWIWIKLSIWFVLGMLPVVFKKMTKKQSWAFVLTMIMAYGTIYLVLYKPL